MRTLSLLSPFLFRHPLHSKENERGPNERLAHEAREVLLPDRLRNRGTLRSPIWWHEYPSVPDMRSSLRQLGSLDICMSESFAKMSVLLQKFRTVSFEDLCELGKDIPQWIILPLQFLPELLFFTINEPRGQRP